MSGDLNTDWDYADVPRDQPDHIRRSGRSRFPWFAGLAGAALGGGIAVLVGVLVLADEDPASPGHSGEVSSEVSAPGTDPPTGPRACASPMECYEQAVANGDLPGLWVQGASLGTDVEGGPCEDGDECTVSVVGQVLSGDEPYEGPAIEVPWRCMADNDQDIALPEPAPVVQPDERGLFVVEVCAHTFVLGGGWGGNSVLVEFPFDGRSNRVSLLEPGPTPEELLEELVSGPMSTVIEGGEP